MSSKIRIAIVSGWVGRGQFDEYRNSFVDSENFISTLFGKLSLECNVVTNRSQIINNKHSFDLEIHLNVQYPITTAPKICLLLEDYSIRPQNYFYKFVDYIKIITWDKSIAISDHIIWSPYPHDINNKKNPNLSDRKNDFVMFSSNRNTLFKKDKSLYNERQKVIDYFEHNDKYNFQLYGPGWNYKYTKSGILGRVMMEANKRFNINKINLKNWKGYVKNKVNILECSKFNFCYENVYGIRGYVSEKIYDSFVSGCVPIYLKPSSDVSNFIPENLYIDPSNFSSFSHLLDHCMSIDSDTYKKYQLSMAEFISKNKSILSSENYFLLVRKIINECV